MNIPSFFRPQSWEQKGQVYRWLGVRKVRPFVAGGSFWQKAGLACRTYWIKDNATGYIKRSIPLEVAHLASFVFLFAVSVFLIMKGDIIGSILIFLLNILLNLYPVLVIRYNRARLWKRFMQSS